MIVEWLIYCVVKTAHERTNEKLWGSGYLAWRNMQRKNYMMLMSFAFLFYMGRMESIWSDQNIPLLVAWAWATQTFIHEFGLSLARGQIETFGMVGTSAWSDLILTKIADFLQMSGTFRLWAIRVVFTLPVTITTYLIIRGG